MMHDDRNSIFCFLTLKAVLAPYCIIVYRTIFVGLFHSILCLLILYVLFSRLGYNEKYTHTHMPAQFKLLCLTLEYSVCYTRWLVADATHRLWKQIKWALFISPPGTIVPCSLMFYCWCFIYLFFYFHARSLSSLGWSPWNFAMWSEVDSVL